MSGTEQDRGCSTERDCTLHNIFCAFPNCTKGRGEGIHALASANAEREELRKDAERLAAIESWGGAHIIHWGDDSEWTVGRCCDLDRDPTADDYAGETLRAAIDAAIAARKP